MKTLKFTLAILLLSVMIAFAQNSTDTTAANSGLFHPNDINQDGCLTGMEQDLNGDGRISNSEAKKAATQNERLGCTQQVQRTKRDRSGWFGISAGATVVTPTRNGGVVVTDVRLGGGATRTTAGGNGFPTNTGGFPNQAQLPQTGTLVVTSDRQKANLQGPGNIPFSMYSFSVGSTLIYASPSVSAGLQDKLNYLNKHTSFRQGVSVSYQMQNVNGLWLPVIIGFA